jgi:hypothetical protein
VPFRAQLQDVSSTSRRPAGGGGAVGPASNTQVLPVSTKKTRAICEKPPGLLGIFSKL